MSPKPIITVGEYLFTRLRQIGAKSIFGVPGDYNLRLLDYVEPSGLNWIGNCNELNAGYAADGYARVNGIGALVTTFGVGELSAVNAIAGAYAELAPVVHIVGTPGRDVQDSRALVHHTLCDGDFDRFAKMYEQVTVAQVDLRKLSECTQKIDWVLAQCLHRSRPVYIRLPDDVAVTKVDATALSEAKVEVSTVLSSPSGDEDRVLQLVMNRIANAQRPAILVDGETRAFGILNHVHKLVSGLGWPTFITGFGKGLIDESLPNVLGIFQGVSQPAQKAYFNAADLVLNFGPHHSKTNTYFETGLSDSSVTIAFGEELVKVDDQIYRDIPARYFVPKLVATLEYSKISCLQPEIPADLAYNGEPEIDQTKNPAADALLDQRNMWPVFNSLLKSGDVVLCETGTAAYGGRCFKLPSQTYFFTSVTWLSIGFMLPATLGTALAQRDRDQNPGAGLIGQQLGTENNGSQLDTLSRTILFIGDGSLQTTVQEISTMIAKKLNITIVVINNDGYTIERCIHGRTQKYNDITEWNYLKAPELFSRHGLQDSKYPVQTFSARTFGELEGLVNGQLADRKPGFRMLEVFVEREDAPRYLRGILDMQIQRHKSD